jgi:hypothetical protein
MRMVLVFLVGFGVGGVGLGHARDRVQELQKVINMTREIAFKNGYVAREHEVRAGTGYDLDRAWTRFDDDVERKRKARERQR